ncbi:DnaJ domain-containing protein [Schumannella sp. 10F1B-5-1]|uniref:J domain-containing protein n=1 Tax=Schumannella sp. 10F1B-5-1 TaxID=2590780 RepID=UPI001130EE83|nr:DnaJ domain-containing protein [Schumannella sp. 10F1B-5-1]TPW70758.1 J domain-containing protein [Schumannella sp. 10F1B-5-1]
MPDSPLSASPYEILGVSPAASDDELRRAFRRRMRATHPDAGGSTAAFDDVQRAWALVGTPESRARYDGRSQTSGDPVAWAPSAPRARQDTRASARSSGHPGGWYRQRYLDEVRAWVGLGDPIPDPYDPALVRRAPWEVRSLLAAAVAEEETARRLGTLGIGFTLWHDVAAGDGKLDHIALGPTGLWALQSADWGAAVAPRRGDLVGDGLEPGGRPVRETVLDARKLGRAAHVRFTAAVIVVPDGHADGVEDIGEMRGVVTLLSERSRVVDLLRRGVPGVAIGGTELFEVRSRLQAAVRYI